MNRLIIGIVCLLATPNIAVALTGDQTCKQMIATGNGGTMDMPQCLCFMKQGEKHLDPDVVNLWREALYYGESRMEQIMGLGISEAKLLRQMKKLQRGARKSCGIKL